MAALTIVTDDGEEYIIPSNSILYCYYDNTQNKSYLVLTSGKDLRATGKNFFNGCCEFFKVKR